MRIVSRCAALAVAGMLAVGSSPATGQSTESGSARAIERLPANALSVPFKVGERLDYEVRFGSLKVGNGSMEVREMAEDFLEEHADLV